MRLPAPGSRKLAVPTATADAPARRKSAASRPDSIPPMPTTGTRTACATLATCCSAIARTAGPETPPVPAPSQGRPDPRGSSAVPLSVLISDRASAPASWAAAPTAAGSVALGVSLTISGLSVSGLRRSTERAVSPGSAPMIRPVSTLGQEKLSSISATSSRSATALTSVASSSRLKPITETQSGTGSSASCGRSLARKPSSPLLGSPIELISPAGVSYSRGGGLPWRGATVMVLLTKQSNGNWSSSSSPNARRAAIASKVPDPFRIGPRSGTPQRFIIGSTVDSRQSTVPWSMACSWCERRLEVARLQHRAINAQAYVADLGRYDAAEAGSKPAGHSGLQRQLCGHLALGADRAYRFEHGWRSARVNGAAVQTVVQQFGHQAGVADRSVVGCKKGVRPENCGGFGVGGGAEAEQHGRVRGQLVVQGQQRRRSDAAADQQRCSTFGRRREADPQRAQDPYALPRLQLREPLRARTDGFEQEVQLAVLVDPCVRERARKVRALAGAATPSLHGGQHEELPRLRP